MRNRILCITVLAVGLFVAGCGPAPTEAPQAAQTEKKPTIAVAVNKATNTATIQLNGSANYHYQLFISQQGSTEGKRQDSGTYINSGLEMDLVQARKVALGQLDGKGKDEVKIELTGIPSGTTLWFQVITAVDELEMKAGLVQKSKVKSCKN